MNKKKIISDGAYSITNNLSNVVLRFFSFYMIIRTLTKSEFGVWVLYLVVTSISDLVVNGFIKNALIKFISSSHKNLHAVINTASLILNVGLSIIVLLILNLSSPFLSMIWSAPELVKMFQLYSILVLVQIFLSHLEFHGIAFLKFRDIFIVNLFRNLSFFFLVLYAYLNAYSFSLYDLIIYQIYAAIIAFVISVWRYHSIISIGRDISKEWLKKLFHFGKYVAGTNLSSMIFKSTDQIILGILIGTQGVAVYNTALKLNNFIDAPINGISNIYYPYLSKKGEDSFKSTYITSVSIILCLLFPVLTLTFIAAKPIILLVAGINYLDSVDILKVTILYSIFIPFWRQFGTLMDSINRPNINLKYTLLTTCINIISSLIFIKMYGVIGAAYGTLLTYMVSFCCVQFYLNKHFNVTLSEIGQSILFTYKESFKSLIKLLAKK